MTTFAEAVIAYLDQYRAAQKDGKFISVDPDGDGDKHVIFVSNDGNVNPSSSSPGKWSNYKPSEDVSDSEKPEIQYKKADLGIKAFEDVPARKNKDGTTRKNSKKSKRLAFGVKGAFQIDRETGKKRNYDSKGNLIERSVAKFDDAAREYGFPADVDPTPQQIAQLRAVAKEVQQEVNQERAEMVDAMRQLFAGSGHGLSTWQSRARNAQDIRDLEDFGIDTIIHGQEYSDAESNLLPILASHAGVPPNSTTEDIVLSALQKPLPKPLALAHPSIVELAGERMANEDEEEYGEYEEDGRGIFGDYEPEDESVPFQATSFADAVQHYAAKPNRDKSGRFIAVDPDGDGEKHVIFVTDDGKVNPHSKDSSKWKGYKPKPEQKSEPPFDPKKAASKTEGMEKARQAFLERSESSGLDTAEKRQTPQAVAQRLKVSGKFPAAHKLSQEDYLGAEITKIHELRQSYVNAENELGEVLRNAKKELGKDSSLMFERPWRQELRRNIENVDGGAEMLAALNKEANGGGYPHPMSAMEWLTASDPSNMSIGELLHDRTQFSHFFASEAIKRHRDKVRRALNSKKAGEVVSEAYERYHEADWYPGDKPSTKRASVKYCNEVDDIKKTDKFRIAASLGRKYKKQANDAVDVVRKSVLRGYREKRRKLSAAFSQAQDELMSSYSTYYATWGNEGTPEYKKAKSDYEKARSKRDELENEFRVLATTARQDLLEKIDKLPSNAKRSSGSGIQIVMSPKYSKKKAEENAPKAEAAAAWLDQISGNAISSMKVYVNPTNRRRSFQRAGDIHMNDGQQTMSVLIHELGHAIDWHTDQHRFTKAYEAQAIQKEKTRWSGGGCEANEVGSQDGFRDAYTGKYYKYPRHSEVMSMGLQELYADPLAFAEDAPDHFNFTVANIRGLLK